MQPTTDTITRLVGRIYDAAASPALWPEFLQDMRETANADMAYVLAVDAGQRCDLSIRLGFDESTIDDYQRHYLSNDTILNAFIKAKGEDGGGVVKTDYFIPTAQLPCSKIFNDFIAHDGVAHHCAATFSELKLGSDAGVCLMRTEHRGRFPEETVALLAILAPHIKRAINLHQSLETARIDGAFLRQSIEAVDLAIISVNGKGEILNITAAAQKILDTCDGLKLGSMHICARVSGEGRRLLELIRGAASTGAGTTNGETVHRSIRVATQASDSAQRAAVRGGAMLISRRPPKRPLQLVVTPFHPSNTSLDERPSALVFLSDPDAIPASRSSILRTLYGLTPMECRLADLLAAGNELCVAADSLKISTQTARFHLKAIFQKTLTNRQTDLVRLILGLPGVR
ncbi:MAG: hypothetical protein WBY53_07010 [Acidobacteriaceae bacterium]